MKHLYLICCAGLLFWISAVWGNDDVGLYRHQMSLGPQGCHVKRVKKGGTQQDGEVYGVSFSYDRLKYWGWYWGVGADYASGVLDGHSGNRKPLKSHFKDGQVDGRFGYTFQQAEGFQVALTPFIGGGYAVEKNDFVSPSPLPVHFKTRYAFVEWGVLSWAHVYGRVEAGLNVKMRLPLAPKCWVSNDPKYEPMTQRMGDRVQYRVDLPITYRLGFRDHVNVVVDPFFEYRSYGGHVNYPFDYFETKFTLWGVALQLQYRI
jgi:hypothetical protein